MDRRSSGAMINTHFGSRVQRSQIDEGNMTGGKRLFGWFSA